MTEIIKYEYLGNEILIHELIKIKKHSIEITKKKENLFRIR